MKKIVLIAALLFATPAIAQIANADLVEEAKVCEEQRALRPLEVTPGSFFKDGWQHCVVTIEECRKTKPNCLEQARIDKETAKKKQSEDFAKKLGK